MTQRSKVLLIATIVLESNSLTVLFEPTPAFVSITLNDIACHKVVQDLFCQAVISNDMV
jgi:hypothetical protein